MGVVNVAATQLSRHLHMEVMVSQEGCSTGPKCVMTVADMGAMVCTAGNALLQNLKLDHLGLQECRGLQDVADTQVQCMGSAV